MEFVDEKDHISFSILHLADHGLQPLLEFPTEFGSGDQSTHVECDDAAILERLRHVSLDDPLREPFRDRCFSNARFPDEHRIVLGAARENLDHTTDFIIAANDWI